PLAYRLGERSVIVGGETWSDADAHRLAAARGNQLPAREPPAPAEDNERMRLEVFGRRRRAGACDVLVRGDEHVRIDTEPSRDEAIVGDLADPDEQIDIIVTQIEATLGLNQEHANLGVGSPHIGDRAEEELPEVWRCAEAHRAGDALLVRGHEVVCVLDRVEPTRALVVEGAPEIRHSKRTRGALDTPGPQLLFELREPTADGRRRDPVRRFLGSGSLP